MAKAVVFGIICVLLIGVFYGINYTTRIDEAQRNLDEAKREEAQLEGAIQHQLNMTAWRKELAALLKASDILSKKNDEIRHEISAMKKSEGRVSEAFIRAVERVRSETIGMKMEQLPLSTGFVYKNVRVQGLERDEMSILHSEGISKVALEFLPEALKDRLRVGMVTYGGSSLSGRPESSASDRMVELARSGGGAKEETKSTSTKTSENRSEGDPGLWNSVTRQSLGRALVPGQGWLEIGPKGPIPGTAKK